MNSVRFICALLAGAIAFGCVSLPSLPDSTAIGSYERGAHIRLSTMQSQLVTGELISTESGEVLVLPEGRTEIVSVSQAEIRKFTVYHARPKHYGWTIPAGVALTALHGYFLVVTLPLSLLVTVPVTLGGEKAFSFNDRNLSFEQLKMHSRFPQGIPPGISRGDIH